MSEHDSSTLLACTGCGLLKDPSAFHADSSLNSGRRRRCKACVREASKEYWHKNRLRLKDQRALSRAIRALKACTVSGCRLGSYNKGLCEPHYQRLRRRGTLAPYREPLESASEGMKRCFRCRAEKPFAEFYQNRHYRDGYYTYCRPCVSEYNRRDDPDRPLRQHRKTIRAVITPDAAAIAWAAGFLEGEGHFRAKQVGGGGATVNATQVNREPLERLQAMFGGSIRLEKHGTIFRWHGYGELGRRVMRAVYPWMSVRRQQQMEGAMPELRTRE